MRLPIVFAVFCLCAQPAVAQTVPGAVEALNSFRAQSSQAALSVSTQLQTMADRHAQDMARRGYFSHTAKDGSDIADRADRVRYGYCALAENIAKGQRSLGEVMQAWADSAGHRRNMLNAQVTEFGLARGPGDVWVMVLGRDGC
jgi:uncharacterized protein YkwD